ncbi:MAG: hypothetical protein KF778_21255 [Rhodocyclaceae bacterium]|nr:hypothetical protein [Rhodocyclaceae bacterium]
MLPAHAGDGHDHGEAPATPAGVASPRFSATSETYELVGILNDRKLSLYLDHTADNSPVKDAKLELEIGGKAVAVTNIGGGEFEATLASEPQPGESPTATVLAGNNSDLLAANLDIHPEVHADKNSGGLPWKPIAGGAAVLLALGAALRMKRNRMVGGAA